jgi:hypothetical protein
MKSVPELDVRGSEYNADPHAVLARARLDAPPARSVRGLEVLRYETAAALMPDRRLRPPDADHMIKRGGSPRMIAFTRSPKPK